MEPKFRLLLLPALIAATSSLAFSDTLLDVDFEGGNVGTWATFDGGSPNSGGVPILTVNNLDTGNFFGQGTENTYATFIDNTDQGRKAAIFQVSPGSSLSLTLTADVYLHASTPINAAILGFYSGTLASNPAPSNRVAGSSLAALPINTLLRFQLFYNGTEDNLTYWDPVEGMSKQLASLSFVGFAYNTVASTWVELNPGLVDTPGGEVTRIAFTSAISSEYAHLSFDNLHIQDGLIPEPSTYALIGGLAALGLVVLRRRKTK